MELKAELNATTTFANSHFENNTAGVNGGAIDWYEGATNGKISNSTFENNTADANGGAVYWYGTNGTIVDSNFTNNRALGTANGTYGDSGDGGAVIWRGSNGIIDNSEFVNNSAATDGGAINLHDGTNVAVVNDIFVNNTAIRGGAIFANTTVDINESNFIDNEAIQGGAAYLNDDDITVTDSDFTDNAAIQGGAVYVDGINNKIINSNFYNNNATYNLRVSTSEDLKTKGGAIYINKENTVIENSKFYNNSANTIRSYNGNGNDPSASDDGFGGAIYVDADNANIKSSEFNDNKACNGSALYNDAADTLLDGDTFIKNQAWSYILNASVVPNSTYYGTTIKISVLNYTGGDNILNGIYNNADVDDIVFNEVTYIVNNSESETRKTGNSVRPVLGATQSTDLYQDSLERYQEITVEIISNSTGEVVRTENIKTDLYGNYSFDISGLVPGNYTIRAYHNEDRNYKYILTTQNLEIISFVDLNITKDVSSYYTIKGNNITFTVTVSNANNASNATNLIIKDVLPVGLEYLSVTYTKGSYNNTTNVWTIEKLENLQN